VQRYSMRQQSAAIDGGGASGTGNGPTADAVRGGKGGTTKDKQRTVKETFIHTMDDFPSLGGGGVGGGSGSSGGISLVHSRQLGTSQPIQPIIDNEGDGSSGGVGRGSSSGRNGGLGGGKGGGGGGGGGGEEPTEASTAVVADGDEKVGSGRVWGAGQAPWSSRSAS
jgi:hypothetical protein